MTRRRHIATLLLFAAVAAPLAGVAIATPPSGLTSTLLARGAAGKFKIHDESLDLRIRARQDTDVAIVQATLAAGGSTGWHGHPGQSIVIVKSGTLTMIEPRGHHRHGCSEQEFTAGQAFAHPEDAHNFENRTGGVTEFVVVYMVPAGAAPLLNDVATVPEQCA